MTELRPSSDELRLLERLSGRERDAEGLAELYARVVWSHLTEPGDAAAGLLVADLGAREALVAAQEGRTRTPGRTEPRRLQDDRKRWMPRLSRDAVRDSLELAARTGLHLLAPDDPGWPAKLGDLDLHAPLVLWVRGDV